MSASCSFSVEYQFRRFDIGVECFGFAGQAALRIRAVVEIRRDAEHHRIGRRDAAARPRLQQRASGSEWIVTWPECGTTREWAGVCSNEAPWQRYDVVRCLNSGCWEIRDEGSGAV